MSSVSLEPGFRLGKYEVLAHIASGGMGAVYKARDLELGRTVALKVLPAHLAQRPTTMERFRREALHAARLSHSHIVTLYEAGYDSTADLHYLALEFVDGIDLGTYISRVGQVPPEDTRRILMQTAKALDHAFGQGVVHRDIKPSNLLLARQGEKMSVKLTDLGLARIQDDDDFKVTRHGSTVGTVDYMAPEQARDSQATDVRSDIYSLGCTAYHMLAGRAPFAEGGLGERVYKHMEVPPPDVRDFSPTVSANFWAILQKMLAKKPDDRYATPADLLRDLKRTAATTSETPAEAAPARPSKLAQLAEPAKSPSSSGGVPCPPESLAVSSSVPTPTPTPTPESAAEPMPTSVGGVTPEQTRAAAAYHTRAVAVLKEGGGEEYAQQLLTRCLQQDPFNKAARKLLRDLNGKASPGLLSRWLGSLNVMSLKSRMRSARSAGDFRKVLEHGEEVLAQQPTDVATHQEMAEAAAELGVPSFAVWLLEQGRKMVPDNPLLLRSLAQLHETRKEWKQAIALWEKVKRLQPNDHDVQRKITDLSVREHIARSDRRS